MLSTKTLDQDMLAYAQTQNLDVHCMDFIETTGFPFNLEYIKSRPFDAVAFTSASAVKYFFENHEAAAFIRGKQIFAIRGKTQDELLAKGITPDITGSSAHELALTIIKSNSAKDILHVCGNIRLPVLEDEMRNAGILYTDLMVYQTGTKAKKTNKNFDAILFYSPSGVESFLTLNNLNSNPVCCCIGNTTAQTLKEKTSAANIIISKEPSPQSMLSEVSNYFQNHSQS